MPAKAGISIILAAPRKGNEIPAFAGMTNINQAARRALVSFFISMSRFMRER